jgi:hypothetical protein
VGQLPLTQSHNNTNNKNSEEILENSCRTVPTTTNISTTICVQPCCWTNHSRVSYYSTFQFWNRHVPLYRLLSYHTMRYGKGLGLPKTSSRVCGFLCVSPNSLTKQEILRHGSSLTCTGTCTALCRLVPVANEPATRNHQNHPINSGFAVHTPCAMRMARTDRGRAGSLLSTLFRTAFHPIYSVSQR